MRERDFLQEHEVTGQRGVSLIYTLGKNSIL